MSSTKVPFSDPPWLMGLPSPYYKETHRKWQAKCREFVDEHLNKYAMDWEREGEVPGHVFKEFAEANMLIPTLPAPLPVEFLKSMGINDVGGVVPLEEWDYLHTMIFSMEMNRSGLNGPASSMTVGIAFGAPPLIKYASQELRDRILPDVLRGKTRICIAITEPEAGSDVANIQTTATKTEDGKHYIVDGQKKWITNGIWADYASMAVRTGGEGPKGITMMVVPLKNTKGVSTRRIHVQGGATSGTTFIEMDEVKVPVENVIGEEGAGMKYIMQNFNHERLMISVGVATQARVALSSAFAYVMKREAFGAPLIENAVVRHRLAKAGADVETLWAWIEAFVYQMCHLKKEDADRELGGLTALAKAKAGMVLNEVSQAALLLFGGNGFTTSGQGEIAERIYREIMAARIPGGAEDVMLDLSVRQLLKNFQAATKKASNTSKM